jgi:hypothetical protein
MNKIMWHLRPALFFAAIAVLAVIGSGCTTAPPVQTGTEYVQFALHKVTRATIRDTCGQTPPHWRAAACAIGRDIYMPVRAGEVTGTTHHSLMLHTYDKAPCNTACVIDGEVHTDVKAWDGPRAAIAGDAVIKVTGAPVGYNDAGLLWHEVLHARGFSHR